VENLWKTTQGIDGTADKKFARCDARIERLSRDKTRRNATPSAAGVVSWCMP
jgi:hypothetical protein